MYFKNLVLLGVISGTALAGRADLRVSVGIGVPVAPAPVVVVREAPPQPYVERPSASPGPDYFWVEGHWDREHDHWIWRHGHWDRRPRREAVWETGHWVPREGGYVWVEGRWVTPEAPPPPPPVVVQEAPRAPEGPEMVVESAPPAPYTEVVPMSPGSDYIWLGGHWAWQGHWVWIHGHYDHRPRHDARWSEGRWDHRSTGWVWIEGRWR